VFKYIYIYEGYSESKNTNPENICKAFGNEPPGSIKCWEVLE
jgi:hypothetical protein